MANVIKGLTVEIGGDTTKLGKALEDVNKKSRSLSSELGQVNKLLKMDPGNADLLAQKQQILSEAVANTTKKLDTLKEAERQVQQQFERGDASAEQVRALQRDIAATEQKLKSYEGAASETAQALDRLGNNSEEAAQDIADIEDAAEESARALEELSRKSAEAAQETADLKNQVADVATKGFKGVVGAVGAAATALTAAAETTREYRTEMGKLDTAFTDNGFSVEAARGAYTELQSILGETDQAVEAANHLAKLTDNEKDLATWSGDILPGVFATFGASLPIEGLTEAANETAKVGQVTGPLADALNWAGISEDEFNASLEKCTNEQERQQLITKTLADTYGAASEAYKETNADVIAANAANEAWTASLAEVGAAVEPVLTSVKTMGAELLSNLVPVIQAILNNLPVIGVTLAGLAASVVAFKISAIAATAATQGMTLAQYAAAAAQRALNLAMAANPIGLIILAITGLVAAFMVLWKNSEAFRNFWTGLWKKIQSAVSGAVDFFKKVPEKIYNAMKGAISKVQSWGKDIVGKAKSAATDTLNGVYNTLKGIPGKVSSAIKGGVTSVVSWGRDMVSKAKTSATNMLNGVYNTLKGIPGKVSSAIKGAVSHVVSWGKDMVNKMKSAASNMVSGVVNTLKGLPGKVKSIGGDLVAGLWNGVNNKLAWLKSKISGFTKSVLNSIKGFFGVHSPSTETEWVGDMLDRGLALGMLQNMKTPIKAMQKVAGGVLDAAQEDIDGLSLERSLTGRPQTSAGIASADSGLTAKLDKILAALERGQILTIDGDRLVGATAARYDAKLGQRRALAARGAL